MVLTGLVLMVAMQADVVDAGLAPEASEQRADAGVTAPPEVDGGLAPVASEQRADAGVPASPVAAATRLRNAFGVGFFGATQRAEVTGQFNERVVTVSTPFIGIRWWTPLGLGPHGRLGLEVAGGVSLFSSELESANGLDVTTQKGVTRRGFGFHAAVPFALAGGEHVIVSVAPEFRYVVNETIAPSDVPLVDQGPSRVPGTSTSDLALRGGVELFFGFIGAPNLSLELTARVLLRWVELRTPNVNNGSLFVSRTFGVTSSISDDPFAVLVSSIAAKYYF